jgi:hypothetical protein
MTAVSELQDPGLVPAASGRGLGERELGQELAADQGVADRELGVAGLDRAADLDGAVAQARPGGVEHVRDHFGGPLSQPGDPVHARMPSG